MSWEGNWNVRGLLPFDAVDDRNACAVWDRFTFSVFDRYDVDAVGRVSRVGPSERQRRQSVNTVNCVDSGTSEKQYDVKRSETAPALRSSTALGS